MVKTKIRIINLIKIIINKSHNKLPKEYISQNKKLAKWSACISNKMPVLMCQRIKSKQLPSYIAQIRTSAK